MLGAGGVGRYFCEEEGSPLFLPVEYRVDGGDLLLLVPEGHEPVAARSETGAVFVTLIVHGQDSDGSGTWIVSARGRLRPVPDDESRVRRLRAEPSAWGGDTPSGRWFEIREARLEGRRVPLASARPDR